MSEKKFVKGLNIKKQEFSNGGSIIKLGIKMADFMGDLYDNNPDGNEWLNVDICESKEGGKMYACYNTYKKSE